MHSIDFAENCEAADLYKISRATKMENWIYVENAQLGNQVIVVNIQRGKEQSQIMSGVANVNSEGLPIDILLL